MMDSSGYVVLLIFINVAIWIILSLVPQLRHKDKLFIILSFVSLWIFLSIREPYSDMVAYENYFQSINIENPEGAFRKGWEFLFKALLFGIKLITNDPHIMISITSLITLVGPFLFIKRYSKNYLLSVIMFITVGSFYMQFFILRQAIALSIFLIVFHFISEKKFIKYCAGIAVAALFHKTALILLLLYPLINIPSSKYKNIAVALSVFICLIFSSQIANFLMKDFYSEYADRVVFGNGIWLFVLYVIMYVIYLLLKRKMNAKEDNSLEKASLFSIFFQFLSFLFSIFLLYFLFLDNFICYSL